jgi:hypothetical protein
LKIRSIKLLLAAATAIPLLISATAAQSVPRSLATLPEADVMIYVSPQKILNEAAPKVMAPAEVAKMRASFADMKKSIGVDPATVEYLVISVRFHKPAGDLSFVAPDVMAVASGDFSADSLFTLVQLSLQDKMRIEKHGSKTIGLMKIDPIAAQAEKMPMLKSLAELGVVPLSANSLAIGNLEYLKSAVDAAEGTRIVASATLESLMRDPNVLMAATGAPISSLAKAFGLFGTQTTPREARCDTAFGNFYTAITMSGNNFNLRGAMNADNPDTAKIVSGLLSGLMQQGIDAVPDKQAQSILQSIKMTTKDNEIVWEANVPEQVVADFLKPSPPAKVEIKQAPPPRRPIRRKRTR